MAGIGGRQYRHKTEDSVTPNTFTYGDLPPRSQLSAPRSSKQPRKYENTHIEMLCLGASRWAPIRDKPNRQHQSSVGFAGHAMQSVHLADGPQ